MEGEVEVEGFIYCGDRLVVSGARQYLLFVVKAVRNHSSAGTLFPRPRGRACVTVTQVTTAPPWTVGEQATAYRHQQPARGNRTKNKEAVYSLHTTSSLYPFSYSIPACISSTKNITCSLGLRSWKYLAAWTGPVVHHSALIDRGRATKGLIYELAFLSNNSNYIHIIARQAPQDHTYLPTNTNHNSPHNGTARPHLPFTRGLTPRAV